jgi:hypothetical protein
MKIIDWWQHLSFSQSGALLLTTLIVLALLLKGVSRD